MHHRIHGHKVGNLFIPILFIYFVKFLFITGSYIKHILCKKLRLRAAGFDIKLFQIINITQIRGNRIGLCGRHNSIGGSVFHMAKKGWPA